jgi:hypothetical protein
MFAAPQTSFLGTFQRHVEAADVNGDGIPDLVVSTGNTLVIATGATSGPSGMTYSPLHSYAAGSEPTGSVIADFDGDGILDIAVAALGGGVYLFRGLGSGGVGNGDFAFIATLPSPSVWDVAAGDVTGDGILDLVAGSTAGAFVVFQGTGSNGVGDGHFIHLRDIPTSGAIKGTVLADLDADGALDIVGATEAPRLVVHKGLKTAGVPNGDFAGAIVVPATGSTYDVVVADFNVDGIPDLASADYTSGQVTVALGLGALGFGPPLSRSVPGTPLGIGTGDFNHDGLPDLVAAAANGGFTFTFLPNSGNFTAGADGFTSSYSFGPARVGYGVAVADLNRDGSPDVAIAGVVENDISSALNNCVTGRPILNIVRVGSGSVARVPDAPDYALGQIVELTAQPSPHSSFVAWSGDASGSQNPISVTMDRSKTVVATFVVVTHHITVTLAGTGTGVVTRSPSTDDPLEGSTVRLTATPAFGSMFAGWSGDATGSANPLDVIIDTDKHIIAAFAPDTTLAPRLLSVSDVPLDQGGKLKLRWNASSLETPGLDPQNLVTQYFVWREIPQAAFLRASAIAGDNAGTLFRHTTTNARDYFWEFVVSLPASRFTGYSYTAVTTNDSTEHGNPFTSFMVQARNAAATRWWDSAPDSGYSVDNLSPPTPGPFVARFGGSANSFHWSPSHAPDLSSYRIYRGASPSFAPNEASLIGAPTDTVFVDRSPTASFYKLAAADIHGNLSHFVLVSPEGPVATLASLVTAEAAADHIALTWFVTEPGMAATLYRRTLSTDWSQLRTLYADGQSFLRYTDTDITRGETYGYRLGIQEAGSMSYFAETYVLAEDTRFALDGISPNPAPGGRMTVRFTLPNDAPATIELLDVTGRRVDRRTLSGQAGRQSVDLGDATRIPPGLYWVRLRHGGREGAIRAVVLQ